MSSRESAARSMSTSVAALRGSTSSNSEGGHVPPSRATPSTSERPKGGSKGAPVSSENCPDGRAGDSGA